MAQQGPGADGAGGRRRGQRDPNGWLSPTHLTVHGPTPPIQTGGIVPLTVQVGAEDRGADRRAGHLDILRSKASHSSTVK